MPRLGCSSSMLKRQKVMQTDEYVDLRRGNDCADKKRYTKHGAQFYIPS